MERLLAAAIMLFRLPVIIGVAAIAWLTSGVPS